MDIKKWFEKAGFQEDNESTVGMVVLRHPDGNVVSIVRVSNYVSLYDGSECIMAGKMHDPKTKKLKKAFKGFDV